jgi:glycosyltransferase involved in cell wall biosynthesis
MNICLVSYEYPPETFDGIGTYTRTLAQSLAALGETVDVITFTSKAPYRYNDKGVNVHRINPVTMKGLWRFDAFFPSKTFAYSIAISDKIYQLMSEKPIDLIEGPEVKAEFFYHLLTRGREKSPPVVVKLHTPGYLVQKHNFHNVRIHEKVLNFLEKQSVLMADHLTAPSWHMKGTIAKDYGIDPRRITVIPHPVDTAAFTPGRARVPNGSIHILFAGRIERIKGVETLARAIPKVVQEVHNCAFTFLGNDTNSSDNRRSLREKLKEYLQTENCADKVTFRDRVEKDALIKYYQDSDIVVIPSLYESLGFVCLEAMACGKAVVASDAGGLSEIVEDRKTGLVAPAGDPGALADCLIELCKDASLRDRVGREARKFVEACYSCEAATKETLDHYKEILAGQKQP